MNTIYKFANWLHRLFVLPHSVVANIYLFCVLIRWLYNNFIDRNPNYKDIPLQKRLILFYNMIGKQVYRDEIFERIDTLSDNIGRGKYIFCLCIWAVIILAII